MSEEELAQLSELEPAFIRWAVRAGVLQQRDMSGRFGIQDAARLRFLKAWEGAGLTVEVIGDLIARGELPFSFMDVGDGRPAAVAEQLRGLLRPPRHRAVDGAAAA